MEKFVCYSFRTLKSISSLLPLIFSGFSPPLIHFSLILSKLFLMSNSSSSFSLYQNASCSFFVLIALLIFSYLPSFPKDSSKSSPAFEKAIALLKKYEGLHKNHGSLIGYGHLVVKGDGYRPGDNLSETQAERLLRKDLKKLCKEFRQLGKDSLFMAVFAYNLGSGGATRSSVYKSLMAGNRNIKASYLSYCTSKGKVISQLQKRRQEEYDTLFVR